MKKKEVFELRTLAKDLFQGKNEVIEEAYREIRNSNDYQSAWRKIMGMYDRVYGM